MEDNSRIDDFYNDLVQSGFTFGGKTDRASYDAMMADDARSKKLYGILIDRGWDLDDYDTWRKGFSSPSMAQQPNTAVYEPKSAVQQTANVPQGGGEDGNEFTAQQLDNMGKEPEKPSFEPTSGKMPDFWQHVNEDGSTKPYNMLETERSLDEQGNTVQKPKLVKGADGTDVYRNPITGEEYNPLSPEGMEMAGQNTRIVTTDLRKANREQVANLSADIDNAFAEYQKKRPTAISYGTYYGGAAGVTNTQDKEFQTLTAAKQSVYDAQKMIEAADANAKNGTFGEWLNSSFAGGATRGFGDKLFDVRTWDMGLSDAVNNKTLYEALQKADSGQELTKSEQMLLDAKAVELATNAYFGSYVGRGYKAGEVTAESLPFMLEMCINPASTAGNTAQSMLARYAMKRLGKKASLEALEKGAKGAFRQAFKEVGAKETAKILGGRLAGDLAGSAAMAATTGTGRVTADAFDRMNNGEEDWGTAIAKAYGGTVIENYSEMVGEYFAPVLGVAGKGATAGLEKIGLGKVNDFIEQVGASDLARMVTDFEKNAKWSGLFSEYAEEVTGNIMNALTVGDMTLDTAEGTGVFNLDQNIDTFLGTALMGGALSGIKTLGYRTPKYSARKAMTGADDTAAALFADPAEWGNIRNTIAFGTDEDAKEMLADVLMSDAFSDEQKAAVMNYASKAEAYKGVMMAEQKRRSENNGSAEVDVETSYDNGQSLETPQEKNDARNMYDMQRERAVEALGDATVEAFDNDPMGALGVIASSNSFTDEERQAALEYVNAKATYDGMIDKVRDDIDSQVAASDALIDGRTYRAEGDKYGMIIPATMKMNDRQVYVISGNVKMMDDGTMVDASASDGAIFVKDAQTGKVELVDAHDILRVDDAINAEQEKATAREAIKQQIAQDQAKKIEGALPFNVGDQYSLADENGQTVQVTVVQDNGDGNVTVNMNGQNVPMSKDQIQTMSDAENMKRLADYQQQKNGGADNAPAADATGTVSGSQQRGYALNDEVVLRDADGNGVRGTIVSEPDADGLYEVETAMPINGKRVNQWSADEIGEMLMEHNGEAVEQPAVEANETAEGVQNPAENVINGGENVQPTGETVQPTGENVQAEPMPMIGEGDDAEPNFLATTPERGLSFLFGESGWEESDADAFLANNVTASAKEVEKLEGKRPKAGTNFAKFNKDMAAWNASKQEAEAKAKYWKQMKELRDAMVAEKNAERKAAEQARQEAERAAAEQDEAAYRAEQERLAAEQEERGANNVAPAIREKWNNAKKVKGLRDQITLPNGKVITGTHYMVEAMAITPSHDANNGFTPTVGFPVNETGENVNTRDYYRDKDAQTFTNNVSADFDERGMGVVVSKDAGIPYSGNGRTMAGQLAATNGTDGKYIGYLAKYGQKYGYTAEQVGEFEHPRDVFVPDEQMPYTSEVFDMFNQQEMKSQSKTEQAVKLGKVVDDATFGRIIDSINKFETLAEFYADNKAATNAIDELQNAGALSQAQRAEMFDGDNISETGRSLLENMLIGKAFESNPDAVREISEYKSMRQSIVMALAEVSNNLRLGEDFSLEEELAQAIDLVYQARKGGYKFGDRVSGYALQQNLGFFGDNATVADYTQATVLMLADVLNDNGVKKLKTVLQTYNGRASSAASNQLSLNFAEDAEAGSGEIETKKQIIKDVIKLLNINYDTARQERAQSVKQNGTDGRSSEGSQSGQNGSGSSETTPEREGNLPEEEVNTSTYGLSDEKDENGKSFVTTKDGSTEFGVIEGVEGLTDAPIKLSIGENIVDSDGVNHGYGLAHIVAHEGREDKIKKAGYDSVEDFVEAVAKNYNTIREGNVVANNQTYLLELTDEHNNTLFIQLSKDGSYWNVNSAGVFRVNYSRNKRVVNTVPALGSSASTDATGVDHGTTKGAAIASGNSPIDSQRKVSNNSATKQTQVDETDIFSQNEAETESADGNSSPVAAAIAAAEAETDTNPSEAQKEAGNYKKGHVKVDGYDITIENPKGSVRSGKDADGKEWSVTMNNTYGYIRGTEGVDGDHIDVFLGEGAEIGTGNVYVIDQVKADGSFDEHKVMYGFGSAEEAREAYLANYSEGWTGLGTITEVSKEEFKKWIESSHRKTKPFSEYKSVKKEGAQGEEPKSAAGDKAYPTYEAGTTFTNGLGESLRISDIRTDNNGKTYPVIEYINKKGVVTHTESASWQYFNTQILKKPADPKREYIMQEKAAEGVGTPAAEEPNTADDEPGTKIDKAVRIMKEIDDLSSELDELYVNGPEAEAERVSAEHMAKYGELEALEKSMTDEEKEALDKRLRDDVDDLDGEWAEWLEAGMKEETGETITPDTSDTSEPQKPNKPKKPAQRKPRKSKPSATTAGDEKIEDVGEKIGGARKDATLNYAKKIDLEATTPSKIFPKPNFASMEKAGVPHETLVKLKAYYTAFSITNKNKRKRNENQRILSARFYASVARDMLLRDVDVFNESADGIVLTDYGKQHLELLVACVEALDKKVESGFFDLDISDVNITIGEFKENENGAYQTKDGKRWVGTYSYGRTNNMAAVRYKLFALDDIEGLAEEYCKQVEEAHSKNVQNEIKIHVYRISSGKCYISAKVKGIADEIKLKDDFSSSKEAFDYIRENGDALRTEARAKADEMKQSKKNGGGTRKPTNDDIERMLRNIVQGTRIGKDYRNGKDVSAEDFMKEFGFRGVEFGNWATQKERQDHLNACYDALMDLADLIGISPKAISLGGKLAMAFGSRGRSSALAHYEPAKHVINLTKEHGAGCVAHEWFHAVDNYFGGGVFGLHMKSAVEGNSRDNLRSEMQKIFTEIGRALNGSDMKSRSKKLGNGDYWASTLEMAARAFESYVNERLMERGQKNQYLSAHVPGEAVEYEALAKNDPYPTAEESKKFGEIFDRLFDTVQEEVGDDGNVNLFQIADVEPGTENVTEAQQLATEAIITALGENAGIDVVMETREEGQRVAAEQNADTEMMALSNNEQEFDSMKKMAHDENGHVLPGLAEKTVTVVPLSDHGFGETFGEAVKNAKEWAKSNLAGKEYDFPEGGKYVISNKAIGKYLSSSAFQKSDNSNVHLSALRMLPEIISNSMDAEIHEDYKKDEDGNRNADNGVDNEHKLVHRLYGAVTLGDKTYRVKTTMYEYRPGEYETNTPHSYEITEIELLDSPVLPAEATKNTIGISNNSISGANLLKNVEKSYDNGVKILENQQNTAEFMQVWHGSAAVFDHFDGAFMGSGEGSQVYGDGHYVTGVESTGRMYATIATENRQRSSEPIVRWKGQQVDFSSVNPLRMAHDVADSSRTIKEARDRAERYADMAEEQEMKNKWSIALDILKQSTKADFKPVPVKGNRQLYEVEIPDDNGKNYLNWNDAVPVSEQDKIEELLFAEVVNDKESDYTEKDSKQFHDDMGFGNKNLSVGDLYGTMTFALGSKKAASALLRKAGFVGVKVPTGNRRGGDGRGMNYVIFDDNDLKITDRVQFMQRPEGTVYGWSEGNRIHLTPEGINPNTPIHEYTHLWAKAVMQKNPKLWNRIKELLQGTPIWDEVVNDPAYQGLTSDDAIASEALSRLSGRKNASKMEKMAQDLLNEAKGNGVFAEANAHNLILKMKQALKDFWKWVGVNLFDMTDVKNIDEVTDRVLYDMLNKTDLALSENGDVATEFQVVTDKATIEKLEASPKMTGYRNVVLRPDGTFGSPMASGLQSKGKAQAKTSGFEKDKWEQAEEHPELADANGKVNLVKPDGKRVDKVDYNPYIHNRPNKVNKQFKQAWERPDLVYIKTEIPMVDLESGYHAEKAAKSVGVHNWPTPSSSQKLILSRYDKPVEIVPWEEVADDWEKEFKKSGVNFDIVPPALLPILAKRGVEILPPHKGMGEACEKAYEDFVANSNVDILFRDNDVEEDKVNTPQFKKWFGDWQKEPKSASKVVDENGKPLVVYHGTDAKFTAFDISKFGKTDMGSVGKGFYFGKNESLAKRHGNNVMPVYLDIKNPIIVNGSADIRTQMLAFSFGRNSVAEVMEAADKFGVELPQEALDLITEDFISEANSHDGVIADGDEFVVKEPTQIKSAVDNNGDFDGSNPDIRFRERTEFDDGEVIDIVGNRGSQDFSLADSTMPSYRTKEELLHAFQEKHPAYAAVLTADGNGIEVTAWKSVLDKNIRKPRRRNGEPTKAEKQRAAYVERKTQIAIANVNEKAQKLGLNVEVITDTESLPKNMADKKGWYNKVTGQITIVLPNHSNGQDVMRTLMHEGVAHHGLREMFGEDFDTFLDNVYANADIEVRRRIAQLAAKKGWDFHTATEEYLAALAEDVDFERKWDQTWWQKIKFFFVDMLRKAGIVLDEKLTDNDLRYILWKSYERMAYADEYGAIRDARTEVMKQRLGVGNYAPSADAQGTRAGTVARPNTAADDNVLMYRDGGRMDQRDHAIVSGRYEREMQNSMYQFREAMQDSMLSLKRLMEFVAEKTGEKVKDYENAYMAENALSSKNHAEQELYGKMLFNPMLDEVHRLANEPAATTGVKEGRDGVTRYMMAKHGLERQRLMAARAEQAGEDSERDFAGLTGLFETDDLNDAIAQAEQLVADFEGAHDVTELWARVNACTKRTLEKTYKSGLLSKEGYETISKMYEYYIPLRGFDATTSDQVYDYLTRERSSFNNPLKKAEGRSSVANDPLATIANMADSAIVQGNKNLMKQKFLKFVMNHPTDVASVNRMWLKKNDITDTWEAVTAQLDENDTPEEILQKTEAFEEKMEQLAQNDPDHYKRGKDAANIPFRTLGKDMDEHMVHVKMGGQNYVITINGNPRVAQALNGLTNPDNDSAGAIGAILKAGEYVNRQMSAFYTTRNPEFVLSNFLRDAIYSNSTMWVRETPNYAVKFNKNFVKYNPKQIYQLLHKHNTGTLDMSNPVEKAFYDFMMNGGETGYTVVKDIEKQKKLIKKYMGGKDSKIPVGKAWDMLGEKLDEYNRSVENCARFAAFLTSREMGRTVERSVMDAKEVSVNFNKKGAGSKFLGKQGQGKWYSLGNIGAMTSGVGRSFYVFWNAAVQGTTNFGRLHKHHTAKALAMDAGLFLLGAVLAGMGSDDDDEYYNLPSYVRRSNICFKMPFFDSYITIPLGIEQRAIYGLGELFSSIASGRERLSGLEIAKEIAAAMSSLMPVDMMEGNGELSGSALVPSYVKPIVEASVNKDWKGMPIYKDTPWNKEDPEYTKASKRTNKMLVNMAEALNEWTGGDDVKKGWVDINPAQVEHVLEGTFGGVSTMLNKLVKMGQVVTGQQDFDLRNVPMVSRVVKSTDKDAEARRINTEYYKYYNEYKETKRLVSHYEKQEDEGILGIAEKLDFWYNSPAYGRYEIVDENYDQVKALTDELKETVEPDERKRLEEEITELKREMIEAVREYDDARKGR